MDLIVPADVICPHCGETFEVEIDTSEAEQILVEDCAVCCRPMQLTVQCKPGELVDLSVTGDF